MINAKEISNLSIIMEELLARIHAVTRRATGDQLSLMQAGHLTVNLITREVRLAKEKVDVKPDAPLIETVRGVGYRMIKPGEE